MLAVDRLDKRTLHERRPDEATCQRQEPEDERHGQVVRDRRDQLHQPEEREDDEACDDRPPEEAPVDAGGVLQDAFDLERLRGHPRHHRPLRYLA